MIDLKSFFLNYFDSFIKHFFQIDILIFIIIFVLAFLIRAKVAKILVNKIRKFFLRFTKNIDEELFDYLLPPLNFLPIVICFLIFTISYDFIPPKGEYLFKINNTFITIFIFWLLHQSIIAFSFIFKKLKNLISKEFFIWVEGSIRYLIIFLGIVAVLEIWGIKIGPVIAGLGLLGVAVALGAQDLFKNLISGIIVLLEKRFKIGDVINVPGHTEGTVEQIGFRSTLIRMFDSTPIAIPNYIFAEAPILNYTNRKNRRINWIIGLEYNSKLEQIKNFTNNIGNYIIENKDFIVDDNYKYFVRLDNFNDSSIDILIYCFTSTNDWDSFLRIKERLAIKIKSEVENLGLNFAFPSHSVYLEKND